MSVCGPLVAIVGTTGVSKSRLAVELALYLRRKSDDVLENGFRGAQVINADAMQVYKGLDLITNKMTQEEQNGVHHHLMGFREPGDQYLVTDWVKDASKSIDKIYAQRELPIVIGGTSYWLQNLIISKQLASLDTDAPPERKEPRPVAKELGERISGLSPEHRSLWDGLPAAAPRAADNPDLCSTMHGLLQALDPPTASRWHWRDARRVLTSLRVIKEQGVEASKVLADQESSARYRTLILWLYSDPSHLRPRLDERVDQMLQRGLLDEVRQLKTLSEEGNASVDYTSGIFQSIGFREFSPYLDNPTPEAFAKATEEMKISTWQYSRRQMKWLRNKLQPAIASQDLIDLFVFSIDGNWETNVQAPARQLLDDFLNNRTLPDDPATSEEARNALAETINPNIGYDSVLEARRRVICDACTKDPAQPVMIEMGEEMALHKRTKSHRKAVKRLLIANEKPKVVP